MNTVPMDLPFSIWDEYLYVDEDLERVYRRRSSRFEKKRNLTRTLPIPSELRPIVLQDPDDNPYSMKYIFRAHAYYRLVEFLHHVFPSMRLTNPEYNEELNANANIETIWTERIHIEEKRSTLIPEGTIGLQGNAREGEEPFIKITDIYSEVLDKLEAAIRIWLQAMLDYPEKQRLKALESSEALRTATNRNTRANRPLPWYFGSSSVPPKETSYAETSVLGRNVVRNTVGSFLTGRLGSLSQQINRLKGNVSGGRRRTLRTRKARSTKARGTMRDSISKK